MFFIKISMLCLMLSSAHVPLFIDTTAPSIRVLRQAGFTIQGRDPAPGFCCALLPANKEPEVYYVTLPNARWTQRQLAYFSQFENLRQIRSHRAASEAEYCMLKEFARDSTYVIVSIRRDN